MPTESPAIAQYRYPPRNWCRAPKRTIVPSLFDIAWAAGIWEGEGHISPVRPYRASMLVGVTQKDTWILYRLKAFFGGSISTRKTGACVSSWQITGPRAMGFIYTIFSHLSPRRREQVKCALKGGA